MDIERRHDGLEARFGHEVIRVEPWGANAARVRVGIDRVRDDLPGALLEQPAPADVKTVLSAREGSIAIGDLTIVITEDAGEGAPQVMLRFIRTSSREELLSEQRAHYWWPGPRVFNALDGGRYRLEQHFRAYPDERLFGLGQRQNGRLDQKGLTLDLIQRNAEVSIPFMTSSRGYGLLWNNPAVGHVELALNRTRWIANAAWQIDYWITAGTPAQILGSYADATGHAPDMPAWATGFWQSKLRYRTQDELLEVAREHRLRQLPLSVIVVDFFHWPALGDWCFDPAEFPNPTAMTDELSQQDTKLMVSVWPLVSPLSRNYDEMANRGLLVSDQRGQTLFTEFPEKRAGRSLPAALYDATNPEARAFLWSKVKENYFDLGARVWWLDACEPELRPSDPASVRLFAGPGDEVINLYPLMHARGFYEGMIGAGERDIVLLCRSAWAGSQRYGAAVWSGDIPATFDSLARQVRAGLNMALSGIPWWTTDIGGFHGGDPNDPEYRELIVRWFQYGAFCPLFRLHGERLPRMPIGTDMTGGPNEVWSYGDEAFEIIRGLLALRERIRPYLAEQMRRAHLEGLPPMRPLFVDYPMDPGSWAVDDEFLLGPDVLVAPVMDLGVRDRDVYLPPGRWRDARTAHHVDGPATISVDAPLDRIPVFTRSEANVPIAG